MTPEYEKGARAQRNNVRRKSNPYRVGSQEWNDWNDGWIDAYDNLAPQEFC